MPFYYRKEAMDNYMEVHEAVLQVLDTAVAHSQDQKAALNPAWVKQKAERILALLEKLKPAGVRR